MNAAKKPSRPPPTPTVTTTNTSSGSSDKVMKAKPRDYQLERMVHAQSATIDMIMKGSSDDTARLIIYLQKRIELEEGYQNSLAQIVHHLEEGDKANPLYQSAVNTHIQQTITDYLHMGQAVRPSRIQFIQTMKTQLQLLVQLKEQQDRARRLHRRNMHQVNSLYLTTRMEELPNARDAYLLKWEEIDRTQTPIPNSPMNPNTPTRAMSPSKSHFFPKTTTSKSSITATTTTTTTTTGSAEDDTFSLSPLSATTTTTSSTLSPRSPYTDDDLLSPQQHIPSLSQVVTQTKLDSLPPPPSPQKRIHQFMKSFQLNHVPDLGKQNARVARLKMEMNEDDLAYRQVIRKLDNLTRKQQAANDYAIRSLQSQLLDKSTVVKQVLDQVLATEMQHTHHESGTIQSMQQAISVFQPECDQNIFNNLLSKDKYPLPAPIYYINHHAGECKDLVFGMSLVEYAQVRGRSPPLVVTRCIEAVERLGGLEKEGIYRVSGKQTTIERIKQGFERDEEAMVFGGNEEVYCIASVIKIFLRELPSPLFPFALADRVTYSQIPDKELRLMNLLTRILKLPGPNYDTLKALVEHLSRLQPFVEKNKMTVTNLSLLFTPAVFQDHNQTQMSPNEWKKDCVLEDLLTNGQTLFADKDLRGASAITGVIDYGFEKVSSEGSNESILLDDHEDNVDNIGDDIDTLLGEKDEYHLPTPYSPPATFTTHPSSSDLLPTVPSTTVPLSSSLHGRDIQNADDKEKNSNSSHTEHGIYTKTTVLPVTPSVSSKLPGISMEPSTSTLSIKEKRNSKFRAVSQDRGLTVNTHHSSIKKPVMIMSNPLVSEPDEETMTERSTTMATATTTDATCDATNQLSPSIQSAVVPSLDWLNHAPEAPEPTPSSSALLRRSATTGRTPLSKRNPGSVPRLPKPSLSSKTTMASTMFS